MEEQGGNPVQQVILKIQLVSNYCILWVFFLNWHYFTPLTVQLSCFVQNIPQTPIVMWTNSAFYVFPYITASSFGSMLVSQIFTAYSEEEGMERSDVIRLSLHFPEGYSPISSVS